MSFATCDTTTARSYLTIIIWGAVQFLGLPPGHYPRQPIVNSEPYGASLVSTAVAGKIIVLKPTQPELSCAREQDPSAPDEDKLERRACALRRHARVMLLMTNGIALCKDDIVIGGSSAKAFDRLHSPKEQIPTGG